MEKALKDRIDKRKRALE
jgi:hypothetical protein